MRNTDLIVCFLNFRQKNFRNRAVLAGNNGEAAVVLHGHFAVAAGFDLYDDLAGDGTNYVVNVNSTTYLSSTGAYVVQDTSPAYAVKCGSILISGGTVRVDASGIASRGLCADGDGGLFCEGCNCR